MCKQILFVYTHICYITNDAEGFSAACTKLSLNNCDRKTSNIVVRGVFILKNV